MFVKIKGMPSKDWNYKLRANKSKVIEMTKYYYHEVLKYKDEYDGKDIIDGARAILRTLQEKGLYNISREDNMRAAALLYALCQTNINLVPEEWITWYENPVKGDVPRNQYKGLHFNDYDSYFEFRWGDWVDYTGKLADKSQKEISQYLEELLDSTNEVAHELTIWQKLIEVSDHLGIPYDVPTVSDEEARMAYYVKSHPTAFSNRVVHTWHCADMKEEEYE